VSGEVQFQSHLQTSRKRNLGQKGDERELSFLGKSISVGIVSHY